MTYLDKDQVLAMLNTMETSYSRKSVMVRATLSDVGAAIAALPAIPPSRGWTQEQIEDALFHVADDLLSEGGSLDYTAGVQDYQRELRDDILAAVPASPLDRENLKCPDCGHRVSSHSADADGCGSCIGGWTGGNCGLTEDQAELGALRLVLRGALPVLETKKETT